MKIAVWLTFALLVATIMIQSFTISVVMRRNGELRQQQELCLGHVDRALKQGRHPTAGQ